MVCVQGEASSETPMSRRGSPEGEGSGAARPQIGSSSMRRHKDKVQTVGFAFPSRAGPRHLILHHQV